MLKNLGKHLIIELYGCDRQLIDDLKKVKIAMLKAAEFAGATILKIEFHQFAPQGVSGYVLIAESHLSIHTWPEYGYCAIDVFTCGDTVKPEKAFDFLKKELCSESESLRVLERGIHDNTPEGKPKPET